MNTKLVSLLLVLVTLFVATGCGSAQYQAGVPGSVSGAGDFRANYGIGMDPMVGPGFGAPPKNVGFLGFAPKACGNGPLSVEFVVENNNFFSVQFDGMDITVMGASGQLPSYLPPRSSTFICMDEMGHHSITVTQYALVGGRMVKLNSFQPNWSGELTRNERHKVWLDNNGVHI